MLFFTILFIAMAIIIYLWPTISIYDFLKRADEKTPGFLVVNLRIPYYLKRYRKMTKIRNGQVGPLYYFWLVALGISIILVFLGLFCQTIQ